MVSVPQRAKFRVPEGKEQRLFITHLQRVRARGIPSDKNTRWRSASFLPRAATKPLGGLLATQHSAGGCERQHEVQPRRHSRNERQLWTSSCQQQVNGVVKGDE